jgi:hypothetical protein
MVPKFKILTVIVVIFLVISSAFAYQTYFQNKPKKKGTYHPDRLIMKKKVDALIIDTKITVDPTDWKGSLESEKEFYCRSPVPSFNKTNITVGKYYANTELDFNDFNSVRAIIIINYKFPWGMLSEPRSVLFIVTNGRSSVYEVFNRTSLAYQIDYSDGLFQVVTDPANSPIDMAYAVEGINFKEHHVFQTFSNVSMDVYKWGGFCM